MSRTRAIVWVSLATVVTVTIGLTLPARADHDARCVGPNACQRWATQFGAPGGGPDWFQGVAVSPDGSRVYATGKGVWFGVQNEFATAAFDANTGAQLWLKNHGGAGDWDFAYDVEVGRDGSLVYTTGWRLLTDSNTRLLETVAYDGATGNEVWVAQHAATGLNPPRGNFPSYHIDGSVLSPDGGTLYVLASALDGEVIVVALDAATGAKRWVGSERLGDGVEMGAITIAPDGSSVLVAGFWQHPDGNDDALALAFDAATGATLWTATLDPSAGGRDRLFAIAAAPNGSAVYGTGVANGASSNVNSADIFTVAFDAADGVVLWSRTFHGGAAGEEARAIQVSPWGDRVFVTGRAAGTDSEWDAVTIAYDAATGADAWTSRYTGRGEWEWGSDMRIAPGGHRLYVTGLLSQPLLSSNQVTIAYDTASGSQVWVQEWNAANVAQDEAYALAIDDIGANVYSAGYGRGFATDFSIAGYGPLTTAPVATLEADPTEGNHPLTVTFTLSGVDLDGLVDGWRLDVDGDGIADYQSPTGPPPTSLDHTYEVPGVFTARLTVSDDHGAVGTDEVVITVQNRPPDAVDDSATAVNGIRVTINVLANDSDPDGDPLRVTGVTDPPHGTAVINPNQTVTYDPECAFQGTETFTYTIDDGYGGTDTAVVSVRVRKTSRRGSIPC